MIKKLNFKNKFFLIIAGIVLSQLAGLVGSVFTFQSVKTWYLTLEKPGFNPPNWIFGPVWTLLYILMGISLGLVLIKEKEEQDNMGKERKLEFKKAKVFFIVQLVSNSFWSVLFFGLKSPDWALVEISFLYLFIVLTMSAFKKISKTAFFLLFPYLTWVSFAIILNFFIVKLNGFF